MRTTGALNRKPKYMLVDKHRENVRLASSYKDIVSMYPVFKNVDNVRAYFRRGWNTPKTINKYGFLTIIKV